MNTSVLACTVLFCCLASPFIAAFGQASTQAQQSGGAASVTALPRIPIPSGPFGIGRIGYDWIDSSRPDRFSADPNAQRELMVYLWYPTARKAADVKGPYIPKQMDAIPDIQSRMSKYFEGNWQYIVSGAIYCHAAEGAHVAKKPGQFPVIVFSHGLGGTGFEYTSLIEDLVSRGYVIAAIEHTETAVVVAFPDGRMVPFHRDSPPAGLTPAERWQRMIEQSTLLISEGAADVRFVLNQLTALNGGDGRQFPLARRLDLNRVAAMGHSAGAEFAARACQLDARFKACVDLDGGMVPVAALPEYPDGATIQQPLLFLENYYPESKMGGTHEEHLAYYKKREEQLQACPKGSFAVALRADGLIHGSYDDSPLLEAHGRAAGTQTALHNQALIQSFIQAFLDKTLKNQQEPLLDGSIASLPEATVQAYGH
jgi:dienelactone hydrolase